MKHAYMLHTGYGKTKLCLDFIMKSTPRIRTLLISTKKIVESAWSAEINKWYPGQLSYAYITGDLKEQERLKIVNQDVDILGMNTEMIDWYIKNTTKVKRKTYTKQGIKEHHDEKELIDRFDLIILDESSLFKNSQTNRFKLLKKWCYKVEHVFTLSATPTPRNIEDVWAQTYLLDGGARLGSSITKFREAYGIPIPLPNGHNRYQYSQQAVDEVLRLIKDISTSVPAPATPLFPEPIIKKVIIKPDPVTANMLEEFKKDYIIKLSNGKNLIAFSKTQLIVKISQMASGFVYNQGTTVHINNLKLQVLNNKLNTITTPVLILYIYKADKDLLLQLPGARLLSSPQDFEDWNNNKIKIGILSPFSTAHGLNLQDSDCQDMFWYSPIWDTEKWIQTNARVCRRGQKRQVTINVLLLKNSFDEYAFELCQEKFKAQYNNLQKLQ
jgi:hypothetical protein